jgi:hypothetical protein
MKKLVLVLLPILSAIFLSSCEKVVGEGPIVTETRSVTNFKKISVNISGVINYSIGPVYKVELQAQQNILDILQTNLSGDELVLKVKEGKRLKTHEDIVINITAPYVQRINLSGSANLFVTGDVENNEMDLKVSGSGNIKIQKVAITEKLIATISGSGGIFIQSGTCKNEHLKISGSGKIDLADILSEKATTEISGSGDMLVNLSQSLNATISGSGSVLYKGNPVITTHISGSGKVQPL